jgi:hypothetical protein
VTLFDVSQFFVDLFFCLKFDASIHILRHHKTMHMSPLYAQSNALVAKAVSKRMKIRRSHALVAHGAERHQVAEIVGAPYGDRLDVRDVKLLQGNFPFATKAVSDARFSPKVLVPERESQHLVDGHPLRFDAARTGRRRRAGGTIGRLSCSTSIV